MNPHVSTKTSHTGQPLATNTACQRHITLMYTTMNLEVGNMEEALATCGTDVRPQTAVATFVFSKFARVDECAMTM